MTAAELKRNHERGNAEDNCQGVEIRSDDGRTITTFTTSDLYDTAIKNYQVWLANNQWQPVDNSFCPTGVGGGVDPSCSPRGSSSIHHADHPEATNHLVKSLRELDTKGHNLVHLVDLREKAGWSKADFDKVITKARKEGKITMSAVEGRHGISDRDREAWIGEIDPVTGRADTHLLYASVRNQWTPLHNSFCPTGKGGGVDPTCSPNQSSKIKLFGVREELLKNGIGLGVLPGKWKETILANGGDEASIPIMTRLFDRHKWGGEDQAIADKEIHEAFNSDTPLGRTMRVQSDIEEGILDMWNDIKGERMAALREESRKEMKDAWENGWGRVNKDAYESWEEQWNTEDEYQYKDKPLLFYRKGDANKDVLATSTNSTGAQSHAVIGDQSQQPHFEPNRKWTAEELHAKGYKILGGFGYINLGYSGENEVTWVKGNSATTNEWTPL